jgi:hypothetical protein
LRGIVKIGAEPHRFFGNFSSPNVL